MSLLLPPLPISVFCFFFFFNDTATTEIYTLSLHDALPIYFLHHPARLAVVAPARVPGGRVRHPPCQRGRARHGARQAASGQRQHSDTRSDVRRVLLFASTAARTHRAPACLGRGAGVLTRPTI